MFKKHHFSLFIFVFFISELFAQNFIIHGDFKNMHFRNELNLVENGFAQLKLLDNDSWLSYSTKDLKVFFEDGESQYLSVDLSENEFIQTELCCYPTKGKIYKLKVKSRLSKFSKNGLAYLKAYFLSKPYSGVEDASLINELILTYNGSLDDWQILSANFTAIGEERYLLIGFMDDIEGEIILDLNPDGFEEGIIIDLESLSLQISSDQQAIQKASEKVEF